MFIKTTLLIFLVFFLTITVRWIIKTEKEMI